MKAQTERFNDLVMSACVAASIDDSPPSLEREGKALRWLSPPILVNQPVNDNRQFFVDFEVLAAPDPPTEFLVITLYLFDSDTSVLQPDVEGRAEILADLDVLNREEPGVKFRFQHSSDSGGNSWIVLENDVRWDKASLEQISMAIERLLDCAEARYLDVETLVLDSD